MNPDEINIFLVLLKYLNALNHMVFEYLTLDRTNAIIIIPLLCLYTSLKKYLQLNNSVV